MNDLWAYNVVDNEWTRVLAQGILPKSRFRHSAEVDVYRRIAPGMLKLFCSIRWSGIKCMFWAVPTTSKIFVTVPVGSASVYSAWIATGIFSHIV
jgi:hypothetical protein